ncbi:hypothetical protein B0T22DRAFT_540249 [Podospora appendiculata]|uniref:BZIP domain-containing protein n=1 Tax=Podospora appendiculata TaxID=314037 RepID=A0AAE0WZ82_9PEZI|nr:hypothetical protein B0T22DRAFT_540249 [Podospora appendiculata]
MTSLTEARKKTSDGPHHIPPLQSMSHQKPQTSNSDTKTLRLTENKRRYRARRKEYISDLETKLAEARAQGVQATKEVQLAAQQVVLENGRLRGLLQLVGFTDAEIDGWRAGCDVHGGDDLNASSCDQQLHLQVTQKAQQCATALAASHCQGSADRKCMTAPGDSEVASENKKGPVQMTDKLDYASTNDGSRPKAFYPSPNSEAETTNPLPTTGVVTTRREDDGPVLEAENTRSSHTSRNDNLNRQTVPSCKILTRLAENPAADITQVPITSTPNRDEEENQDADAPHGEDGIKCRKAYDMLIQYATTEEKMDTVARVLESGCTENGKGGCAVRSKIILQALDDICG